MKETMRKWKIFGAWNLEKEVNWLVEMAREGWILESVGLFNYTFKKAEPCEMCYQLDFSTHKIKDQEEYHSIYAEAGWGLIGKMGGWNYFGKPKKEGETQTIYTDKQSLIEMFKRIISFLVIINGPTVYFLVIMHSSFTMAMPAAINIIILSLFVLVEFGIAYAIVRLLIHIRKLKAEALQ